MILAFDWTAFANSSCASASDFPVASDCAETARMPLASSSVRLACKTRSAVPKCSTSFRMRDGPNPWVSASASQHVLSWEAGFAGVACVDIPGDALVDIGVDDIGATLAAPG